jgi:hypothetical protein
MRLIDPLTSEAGLSGHREVANHNFSLEQPHFRHFSNSQWPCGCLCSQARQTGTKQKRAYAPHLTVLMHRAGMIR